MKTQTIKHSHYHYTKNSSYKILLLLSFFFIKKTYSQDTYPLFEDIVTTFFKTYTLNEGQTYQSIRFIKAFEGYFIEEYDYDIKLYHNKKLFWSVKSKTYLSLNFAKNTTSSEAISEVFLKHSDAHRFNKSPYYGYINWDKDVIRLLEGKEKLTDDELYALGRSYASLSGNLLSNNSGLADSLSMFPLKETGLNQLNKKQLKKYRTYVGKSTKAYESLCYRNPNYKTLVGGICHKLHNEYTSSFLNVRLYQNEEEALKELPKELYSDFFLDFAKNSLDSCEPNAILFTSGDNDTFPLLYLQAQKEYRQDVTVINLSLLNSNRYVNYLRSNNIFKAPAIKMQLSIDAYKGDKLGYINLKSFEASVRLEDEIKLINQESNQSKKEQNFTTFFPSKRLKLNFKNSATLPINIDKDYISKAEILVFDIIQQNNNRPIYMPMYNMRMLKHFLEMQGINYKVVLNPKNKIETPHYYGGINEEKTFLLLTDQFNFKSIKGKEKRKNNSLYFTYIQSFNQLIQHYAKTKNKEKITLLLDKYIECFSEEFYVDIKYTNLEIIINAYDMDMAKQGSIITNRLLKGIEISIDALEGEKKTKTKKEELNLILYILKKLKKEIDSSTTMFKKAHTLETLSTNLLMKLG